jgi:Family of unknown function (DUF5691)
VTAWDELVSTALVGTERRQVPEVAVAGVAAGDDDAAAVLLDRAALLVAERRAGWVARRAEPLPAAPAERAPAASPAAARRLARLLDADHAELLSEWLSVAAARGVRAPAALLPDLLQRGRGDRALRAAIAAVAGERGIWLAGLNPDWAYLLAERGADPAADGAEVWEFGAAGHRRDHLARLRAHDPAAARELLAASWAEETPDDRALFLAVLDDGLAAADEPFLDRALDDRRAAVRDLAADLLVRLPGSALGHRMAERAHRCVRVERRRLGARLAVEPPAGCDRAMQRDGVRCRAPKGTGERAWWLEQVVARTPLASWIGWLGATPAEILRLKPDEWGPVVKAGWVRAAILQRDPAWAGALLAVRPNRELLAVLPPGERSSHAARLVGDAAFAGLPVLLDEEPGPWDGQLAEAVLARIRKARKNDWQLGQVCRLAAVRLRPELAARVEELTGDPPRPLVDLAATLRFRHDMLKELR